LDSSRTEFGYPRSVCACRECSEYCHHLPGYLVPADLERLREYVAPHEDLLSWARRFLLASPGAKVMRGGRVLCIPTLVPARQANGACTFLTADGRCTVHADAPFGCAFFDAHQNATEADQRSLRGLQAVMAAWTSGGAYAQLWVALHDAGLRAPGPEACRRQLQRAAESEPV
jgi:Fe-S-cluster containining protein